jgi:uncharacterized protein YeaO (DUF488 family)
VQARRWRRGLAREAAQLGEWLKTIAPSDELRRWYARDPERLAEFRRRYAVELDQPERARALLHLRELAGARSVTLLTATRDLAHSHALDLVERLRAFQESEAAAEQERGGEPACWRPRVCPECGGLAGADPHPALTRPPRNRGPPSAGGRADSSAGLRRSLLRGVRPAGRAGAERRQRDAE